MTSSPLKFAENAILIFKVPTDGVVYNEFGNPVTAKKDFVIKAAMKTKSALNKTYKNYENREGVDVTDVVLQGHLIEPLEYPSFIVDGMIADAEVKLYKNKLCKGTFLLIQQPVNPIILALNIQGVAGITRIEGNFRILETIDIS